MNEDRSFPPELLEEYEALKKSYIENLKVEIPLLRSSFDTLIKNKDAASLKDFYGRIHKLTSSSAMYGYSDISGFCHEIAVSIKQASPDVSYVNDELVSNVKKHYDCLDEILNKC